MSTCKTKKIPNLFALLSLMMLAGCATNFEPPPLSADHPASVQAQEAPRIGMKRLIGTDEITRKTNAQLARNDAPNPDFQAEGMTHDMSSMKGMDHSQMKGMEGMDHSKMPNMTTPTKNANDAEKTTTKPSPSSSQHSQNKDAYWTCVMHPEIHENKPGECPKCGMTLVKKEGTSK